MRRWLDTGSRLGILALLALLTPLVVGCGSSAPLSRSDEVAIYAAAIRKQYGPDDTFGGTLEPSIIYLVSRTDDRVGDPDLEGEASQELPQTIQDGLTLALADLPATIAWVDNPASIPLDAGSGALADGGVIIRLGNLHPQRGGSVQVSTSIYVAGLAAGGQTYVVERVDGVWTVTGTTGVQWIS